MVKLIRPPDKKDVTAFLRMLFLRAERELIDEITRKRERGLVDYAEVASLERVQRILQSLVDRSWAYVPEMIEAIFYRSDKDAAGYRNARNLTSARMDIVQQLGNNLMGQIIEASQKAQESVQTLYTIARLEADPFRETALKEVLRQQAAGGSWVKGSAQMVKEMQAKGVTAFVDKAGRQWSLQAYGNMAVRTTARQAQVAALLTADDHDLWQIVKIGSTCPVCAALEGRVYSKSGTDPDYPPLSLAFGKVDPDGPDDLANTYLNIHPNCMHSFIKYTTIGKTEKQIQKDKDFSDPEKNPLDRDPRTKKQIKAYREKERERQRYLRDVRQHKEYRAVLGADVPKDLVKFREMKYNGGEKWDAIKADFRDARRYDRLIEASADLNIKGKPLRKIDRIDVSDFEFQDTHINTDRRHGVTKQEAQAYIDRAVAVYSRWNGKVNVYISAKGAAVVNLEEKKISTAYHAEEYDEKFTKLLEVLGIDRLSADR